MLLSDSKVNKLSFNNSKTTLLKTLICAGYGNVLMQFYSSKATSNFVENIDLCWR